MSLMVGQQPPLEDLGIESDCSSVYSHDSSEASGGGTETNNIIGEDQKGLEKLAPGHIWG